MSHTLKRLGKFFVISLALGIAPGPDILFVLTQALSQGPQAGFLVTLGLCTGLCVHVTLAAFGIASFLKKFPKAFPAITWCGAIYLLYLAWLTWQNISPNATLDSASNVATLTPAKLYMRGIIMNLCNPKVMLFFLALMPGFIVKGKLNTGLQFLILGGIFIIATFLVFNIVAILGGAISQFLSQSPSAYANLQRISAFVMVAIALWIAVENIKSIKKARTTQEEA